MKVVKKSPYRSGDVVKTSPLLACTARSGDVVPLKGDIIYDETRRKKVLEVMPEKAGNGNQ